MFFLTLLAIVSAVQIGAVQHPSYIVGGSIVRTNELPFAVHLLADNSPRCGAAILSPNWIVTAAHCITKNNALITSKLTVTVGSAGEGKVYQIKSMVYHPDYDSTSFKNDIAIIRMENSLPVNSKTQPIPISLATVEPNETLRAAGWGQTEMEVNSKQLREVQVQTTPFSVCAQYVTNFKDYNGSQICTGMTPGRDTCGGDSGGPLFRSEDGVLKLVGLTSYGAFNPNDRLKCGGKGSVGVYTHVLSYMEYIEGVTGLSFNELTSSEFRHQAGYVVSALSTNSLAKSMVPLLVASAIFMFKV